MAIRPARLMPDEKLLRFSRFLALGDRFLKARKSQAVLDMWWTI
ncbi:hypothetical protein [Amazonocrinis nigriterrae]|nr:hypothetical protein [Amazonocrinis nigriterrae]